MLMVGLTGGIGAGKSVVAARLDRLGAVIVDSDVLAREVVAPGTVGLAEVVAAFGPGVLGGDGALDRPALSSRVFGDETARRRLEGIIHPRVRSRSLELVAAAPADAVVVHDVPLLVEVGLAPTFHLVVVVEAARRIRVDRLTATRPMTADEATARIAAQAGDAERRAVADVLLRNDGALAELHRRVDELWRERLVPYERNVRLGRPAPVPDRVRIVPPDPTWPAQAERLIGRIRHALGGRDVEVEHIGSTAVPGLSGTDVIDIQVGFRSAADADAAVPVLAAAGFPAVPGARSPQDRDEAGQQRLHGSADPGRPATVLLRVAGSEDWRFALLLRDYLWAVPEARDAYASVKRDLAAALPEPAAYAAGKQRWFDAEITAARAWAERTGWRAAPR